METMKEKVDARLSDAYLGARRDYPSKQAINIASSIQNTIRDSVKDLPEMILTNGREWSGRLLKNIENLYTTPDRVQNGFEINGQYYPNYETAVKLALYSGSINYDKESFNPDGTLKDEKLKEEVNNFSVNDPVKKRQIASTDMSIRNNILKWYANNNIESMKSIVDTSSLPDLVYGIDDLTKPVGNDEHKIATRYLIVNGIGKKSIEFQKYGKQIPQYFLDQMKEILPETLYKSIELNNSDASIQDNMMSPDGVYVKEIIPMIATLYNQLKMNNRDNKTEEELLDIATKQVHEQILKRLDPSGRMSDVKNFTPSEEKPVTQENVIQDVTQAVTEDVEQENVAQAVEQENVAQDTVPTQKVAPPNMLSSFERTMLMNKIVLNNGGNTNNMSFAASKANVRNLDPRTITLNENDPRYEATVASMAKEMDNVNLTQIDELAKKDLIKMFNSPNAFEQQLGKLQTAAYVERISLLGGRTHALYPYMESFISVLREDLGDKVRSSVADGIVEFLIVRHPELTDLFEKIPESKQNTLKFVNDYLATITKDNPEGNLKDIRKLLSEQLPAANNIGYNNGQTTWLDVFDKVTMKRLREDPRKPIQFAGFAIESRNSGVGVWMSNTMGVLGSVVAEAGISFVGGGLLGGAVGGLAGGLATAAIGAVGGGLVIGGVAWEALAKATGFEGYSPSGLYRKTADYVKSKLNNTLDNTLHRETSGDWVNDLTEESVNDVFNTYRRNLLRPDGSPTSHEDILKIIGDKTGLDHNKIGDILMSGTYISDMLDNKRVDVSQISPSQMSIMRKMIPTMYRATQRLIEQGDIEKRKLIDSSFTEKLSNDEYRKQLISDYESAKAENRLPKPEDLYELPNTLNFSTPEKMQPLMNDPDFKTYLRNEFTKYVQHTPLNDIGNNKIEYDKLIARENNYNNILKNLRSFNDRLNLVVPKQPNLLLSPKIELPESNILMPPKPDFMKNDLVTPQTPPLEYPKSSSSSILDDENVNDVEAVQDSIQTEKDNGVTQKDINEGVRKGVEKYMQYGKSPLRHPNDESGQTKVKTSKTVLNRLTELINKNPNATLEDLLKRNDDMNATLKPAARVDSDLVRQTYVGTYKSVYYTNPTNFAVAKLSASSAKGTQLEGFWSMAHSVSDTPIKNDLYRDITLPKHLVYVADMPLFDKKGNMINLSSIDSNVSAEKIKPVLTKTVQDFVSDKITLNTPSYSKQIFTSKGKYINKLNISNKIDATKPKEVVAWLLDHDVSDIDTLQEFKMHLIKDFNTEKSLYKNEYKSLVDKKIIPFNEFETEKVLDKNGVERLRPIYDAEKQEFRRRVTYDIPKTSVVNTTNTIGEEEAYSLEGFDTNEVNKYRNRNNRHFQSEMEKIANSEAFTNKFGKYDGNLSADQLIWITSQDDFKKFLEDRSGRRVAVNKLINENKQLLQSNSGKTLFREQIKTNKNVEDLTNTTSPQIKEVISKTMGTENVTEEVVKKFIEKEPELSEYLIGNIKAFDKIQSNMESPNVSDVRNGEPIRTEGERVSETEPIREEPIRETTEGGGTTSGGSGTPRDKERAARERIHETKMQEYSDMADKQGGFKVGEGLKRVGTQAKRILGEGIGAIFRISLAPNKDDYTFDIATLMADSDYTGSTEYHDPVWNVDVPNDIVLTNRNVMRAIRNTGTPDYSSFKEGDQVILSKVPNIRGTYFVSRKDSKGNIITINDKNHEQISIKMESEDTYSPLDSIFSYGGIKYHKDYTKQFNVDIYRSNVLTNNDINQ